MLRSMMYVATPSGCSLRRSESASMPRPIRSSERKRSSACCLVRDMNSSILPETGGSVESCGSLSNLNPRITDHEQEMAFATPASRLYYRLCPSGLDKPPLHREECDI